MSQTLTSLDFAELRRQNAARLVHWHGAVDAWSLADWSNAMCGEAGEAANVVKKLRRIETHLWWQQSYADDASSTPGVVDLTAGQARLALTRLLAGELADVVCYADLLAHKAGIDLGAVVIDKFNKVSIAQGFPELLGRPAVREPGA